MAWSEYEKSLISLNEYGIFSATFTNFPDSPNTTNHISFTIFEVTCCGLDIHSELNLVAVGDFSGNLYIFDYETDKILAKIKVSGSIRTVVFKQEILYIGTIEGDIYT